MKVSGLVVIAAVVGCGVSLAGNASAWLVRQASFDCVPATLAPDGTSDATADSGLQGYFLANSNPTSIFCAFPETDVALKHNLVSTNVHARGLNALARMDTQACISFWNAFGGSCGGVVSTGPAINLDQSLGKPAAWAANDGHFAYLAIRAPSAPGATGFVHKGNFYAN